MIVIRVKSNKLHRIWHIRVCSYYEAGDKLLQNFVKWLLGEWNFGRLRGGCDDHRNMDYRRLIMGGGADRNG